MIINSTGTQVISNLGWVDKGALWVYGVGAASARTIGLGDARYLTIKQGLDEYFAVVHHHDGNRLEISAHSHSEPGQKLAQVAIRPGANGTAPEPVFEGDGSVWRLLPRAYTAFAFGDYHLFVLRTNADVSIQTFGWFDDSYDKGYQGIVDVTEVPSSDLLIVSVARDSHPVVYNPNTKQAVAKLSLAGRYGNPELYVRRKTNEVWATDYDTLVKLDATSFKPIHQMRLQGSASGTAQFVGRFCFTADEELCILARPFSGDVVALDPANMRVRYRAPLGKQPLDAALLADARVVARDWKTGAFLSAELSKA